MLAYSTEIQSQTDIGAARYRRHDAQDTQQLCAEK